MVEFDRTFFLLPSVQHGLTLFREEGRAGLTLTLRARHGLHDS